MEDMQWINFGNKARDLNLCGTIGTAAADPAQYIWTDAQTIDLSGPVATGTL